MALSSGLLPAGVAVVRLTGPSVRDIVVSLTGILPTPRLARYGILRLADGSKLDSGLTLFFPAPYSFTGEDCCEFHVHGGRAVVEALLKAICAHPDCRTAVAGEFTRRAFLNGKMGLLDAEATADIVSAETEGQRRFAASNSQGGHAALYAGWRTRLIQARALIEAELDFSDEGDVPGSVSDLVWNDVAGLRREIEDHAAGYAKAEMLREGFVVVLLGAPNSGKSSLLNALVRREVAIVTDEPGTTRDIIEVGLDINGLKIRLIDTAGIRMGEGEVERIGIDRARARARDASLVLHLIDLEHPRPVDTSEMKGKVLRIGTKNDQWQPDDADTYDHLISSHSGDGLQALLADIGNRAVSDAPVAGSLIPWRLRHVELLTEAALRLNAALDDDLDLELRSEELRLASNAIGRITGAIDVEDLLDTIFGQFCIGK